MVTGRMYGLNSILKTEKMRYLLEADGEFGGYEISFGRNRKLAVSSNCYIVTLCLHGFELEKIEFDENFECDYLRVLREKNIPYEIPKKLPPSINRLYSRLQCAIGRTYWAGNMHGFFGKNGYAITDVSYIGDDRYESFNIHFCLDPNSFHIGENAIKYMYGEEVPNTSFLIKLLEEEVNVEQGEPVIKMFRDAGILHYADIDLETTEE